MPCHVPFTPSARSKTRTNENRRPSLTLRSDALQCKLEGFLRRSEKAGNRPDFIFLSPPQGDPPDMSHFLLRVGCAICLPPGLPGRPPVVHICSSRKLGPWCVVFLSSSLLMPHAACSMQRNGQERDKNKSNIEWQGGWGGSLSSAFL
jgi:hypothetical protein